MTLALETVLARAGLRVDPDEFLRLVERSAQKVAPVHPDPAAHLTGEQRAALSQAGFDLAVDGAGEPCPRAQSVVALSVLDESAYTAREAAATLGLSASEVRERIRAGRLAAWKDRAWRLPGWQFTGGEVLPGLDTVLAHVPPDLPALVAAAFMNTAQPDLEIDERPVSPREWLLSRRDPDAVAALVATLGLAA